MKKLEELLTELFEIQNYKDQRLAILVLFLYAEHYINELTSKHNIDTTHLYICECGRKTGNRGLSLVEKIDKLIEAHIIRDDLRKPFKLLYDIRNRLAHDLSPSNEKIEQWIDRYTPPTEDRILQLLNSESPWAKLYITVITAIASIYSEIPDSVNRLYEIQKNTLTGKWTFVFEKSPDSKIKPEGGTFPLALVGNKKSPI
jgi:hypothetical protein